MSAEEALDLISPGAHQKLKERVEKLKYDPLSSDGDRCNAVASKALTFGQAIVQTACQSLAKNKNRGLLVWHSTGSGKTCAAVAAMEAFWDTDREFIYATHIEGNRANPTSTFATCARNFFPKIASVKGFEDKMDKRIQRFSFQRLAHKLMVEKPLKVETEAEKQQNMTMLNRSLLIMDEVHSLMHPPAGYEKEHNALLQFFLSADDPKLENAKILIMTATPGTDPYETIGLLNIVRDRRTPALDPNALLAGLGSPETMATTLEEFGGKTRGLVSHVDASSDTSIFPVIVKDERVECPMPRAQYEKYLEKLSSTPDDEVDFDALLLRSETQKYWQQARRYSNSSYDIEPGTTVKDISGKLHVAIGRIVTRPLEKHYLYSAFASSRGFGGHGVQMIAKVLESDHGYEKLKVEEAMRLAATDSLPPPKKRYVMLTSRELSGDTSSDKRERDALKAITKIFNSEKNATGEIVHLVLASQRYNESVDLHEVRHVHLFEPLLSKVAEKQTIGRAVRRCSHKKLPKHEWTVHVHRYFSMPPSAGAEAITSDQLEKMQAEASELAAKVNVAPVGSLERDFFYEKLQMLTKQIAAAEESIKSRKLMIDDEIYVDAMRRGYALDLLEGVLRRSAIDCLLTHDFHGLGNNRCIV